MDEFAIIISWWNFSYYISGTDMTSLQKKVQPWDKVYVSVHMITLAQMGQMSCLGRHSTSGALPRPVRKVLDPWVRICLVTDLTLASGENILRKWIQKWLNWHHFNIILEHSRPLLRSKCSTISYLKDIDIPRSRISPVTNLTPTLVKIFAKNVTKMAQLAPFSHYFSLSWSLLKPRCPRRANLNDINMCLDLEFVRLNTKVHGWFYKKTTQPLVKVAIF